MDGGVAGSAAASFIKIGQRQAFGVGEISRVAVGRGERRDEMDAPLVWQQLACPCCSGLSAPLGCREPPGPRV